MIRSCLLENHESHKETLLEFSLGLNVFIGPTDAGKSSALRGIKWVLDNSPNGESMRPKFWEGTTKSTIVFENPDATVCRMKGKGINHYQLNNNKPINSGAKLPPDEIAEAIMMDTVNFQTQVDRAFLMFETPGERGRILNKIAGLDVIDKALDNSSKDEKRLLREYKTEKALLAERRSDMEEYSNLPEIEQKLIFLEQVQQYANQSDNRAVKLKGIISQIKQVEADLKDATKLLPAEERLESLSKLVLLIDKALARAETLGILCAEIKSVEKGLKSAEDHQEMEDGLVHLEKLPGKIEVYEKRASKLSSLIDQIKKVESRIIKTDKEVKELEANLPNDCPTCGAEL